MPPVTPSTRLPCGSSTHCLYSAALKFRLTKSAHAYSIRFRVQSFRRASQPWIAELWDTQAIFGATPTMRIAKRKAALTFWMRVEALAALIAISLAGCATGDPVASRPIEGPVRLGEIAAVDGPTVRPDWVIEDSRCPADVQCIQAGRLVIRSTVLGGGWSKEIDLTLGVPVPVADGMLTLIDATPVPVAGETSRSAARFTFKFQGGR